MDRSDREAALLICTYQRPRSFGALIETVTQQRLPPGWTLSLVISDNNPVSQRDGYVARAMAGAGWSWHYGHEPTKGYSSARNKAVDVALRTRADVFLMVDDDMLLDPGWVAGHLTSLEELGADVVTGMQAGMRERYGHGHRLKKCGAGNVSFLRWLVDPVCEGGANLRFDPQFNLTGREDQAFFGAAVSRGAVIKKSNYPLLSNGIGDNEAADGEIENKLMTAEVMEYNHVVTTKAKGGAQAFVASMWGPIWIIKGGLVAAEGLVLRLGGASAAVSKRRIESRRHWRKARGRIMGLFGSEIRARQDVRRSDPV